MPPLLPAPVAVRVPRGQPISPYGDVPAALPVLNRPLAVLQEETLRAAGVELVATPPKDRPYLLVSDRCWFSPELLRLLLASPTDGRLHLDDPDWLALGDPMLPDRARPEIARVPAGAPPIFDGLPDLTLDLKLQKEPSPIRHPALDHASQGAWVSGRALAHDIDHWVHLLRVNLLALSARGADLKAAFDQGSLLDKLRVGLPVVWRAGRLTEAAILRAVSTIHPSAKIHPTAVVEACDIGPDCTIGPGSILRGCLLGARVTVEPQACVVASVIGDGATVGRGAGISVCLLMDGAWVSGGPSRQMGVFGRDSFLAQDNETIDLSFGASIKVEHRGRRVDTGTWFLGCAVGHRAKIGAAVRISYGVEVPNDALLVAPSEDLLRAWPEPIDGPATTRDGRAVPARRG